MGGFAKVPQLGLGQIPPQQSQPAIGRRDESLSVDVLEGVLQAMANFIDGLKPALGDGDDAENNRRVPEKLE